MKKAETLFLELKQAGLRLTKARQACVEVLLASRTPLSVAQILERLGRKEVLVNKTTVYRELEKLKKIGMVENVPLSDRQQYFELAAHHHHHLVCVRCQTVEEVAIDERALLQGEERAKQEKQFMIIRHSLEFFGVCGNCQMAEKSC